MACGRVDFPSCIIRMKYRTEFLSLNFFRRGIVDAFRFMSIFLLLPRSREEINEPKSRLVHEWVVGRWWLSDWTLLARASDRTQVLLMTVLAQHNTCTYVMTNMIIYN